MIDEVENIDLTKDRQALAEIRSVLTAVVEHLWYRQQEKERNL